MNRKRALWPLILVLAFALGVLTARALPAAASLPPIVSASTDPTVPRPVIVRGGYARVVLQAEHARTFEPGTPIMVVFGEDINTYVLLGWVDEMLAFTEDEYAHLEWTWLLDPWVTPTPDDIPTSVLTQTPTPQPSPTKTPQTSLSYLPLVVK